MIAVTGMHRSGTSCITGLLAKCGLSLGTSHPVFCDPHKDNLKGHFENRGALLVNEMIVVGAGGSWENPPEPKAIVLAGIRQREQLLQFNRTFNGDIFKDPRLCLTISLWDKFCSNLEAVVFCVRNPLAVAKSLQRRNGIPIEKGLRLWHEYNVRFIMSAKSTPVFVVDYDNLRKDCAFEMSGLCGDLGINLDIEEIRARIGDFYADELNHDEGAGEQLDALPADIRQLYDVILSQSYTRRRKVSAPLAATV